MGMEKIWSGTTSKVFVLYFSTHFLLLFKIPLKFPFLFLHIFGIVKLNKVHFPFIKYFQDSVMKIDIRLDFLFNVVF